MSDSDEPRNCNTEPLRGSFCESTDSEDSIYPQSPDGGWGWVVLISSFLLNLIADGCAYSFGVFFTELLETFGETKSKTSWVGSLFVGVSLICGPLAGALTTKFGCRKMTIAGGILSMTGMVASAFVNSIEMLCFTFGFVAGFGMSIPYVTSIVSVSFYFEKKRALATGLSVCGSGIGTSVFAPLLEYLIDIYGWRGTMLILGGIVGNVVVCGCLLRPLEYSPKEKYEKALETFTKISKNDARLNSKFDEGLSSRSYDAQLTYCSNIANLVVSNSVVHLPTYLQLKRVSISNEVFHKLWGNSCHNSEVRVVLGEPNVKQTTSYPDSFSSNRIVAPPFCTSDNLPEKGMKDVWQQKSSTKRKPSAASQQTILYRKDIFYRGNLLKLSLDQKSCSCPEISHLVGTADDPDSAEDFLEWCELMKTRNLLKQMKKLLKTMVNRSVLTHPMFILFVVSNFIFFFWGDIPYIYIVDQSVQKGVPQHKASYLLSVFGLVSTFGQIVFGFVGDRMHKQLTIVYAISTLISGLSIILMPLCTDYVFLSVTSAIFGFFSSANNSLCTILLVDYLGLDNLTSAYGLMLLYQGIANLLGPPVAGLLCDTYGSYDYSFYASGAFVILSGLILVPTPYLQCWYQNQQKKHTQKKQQQNQEPSTSKPNHKVMSQMETVV